MRKQEFNGKNSHDGKKEWRSTIHACAETNILLHKNFEYWWILWPAW